MSSCLSCESDRQQVGKDGSASRLTDYEHRCVLGSEPHNGGDAFRRMGEAEAEVGQMQMQHTRNTLFRTQERKQHTRCPYVELRKQDLRSRCDGAEEETVAEQSIVVVSECSRASTV